MESPVRKLRHREASSCPSEWGQGGSRTLVSAPRMAGCPAPATLLSLRSTVSTHPSAGLGLVLDLQLLCSARPQPPSRHFCAGTRQSYTPPMSPEGLSQESGGRPCLCWPLAQHPRGEAGRALSWAILLQRVPAAQYQPGARPRLGGAQRPLPRFQLACLCSGCVFEGQALALACCLRRVWPQCRPPHTASPGQRSIPWGRLGLL